MSYRTREAHFSFEWAFDNRCSLYAITLIVRKAIQASAFHSYKFWLGLVLASLHIGRRNVTDTNIVADGGRSASGPLLNIKEMREVSEPLENWNYLSWLFGSLGSCAPSVHHRVWIDTREDAEISVTKKSFNVHLGAGAFGRIAMR
jgi:hypothetical protein